MPQHSIFIQKYLQENFNINHNTRIIFIVPHFSYHKSLTLQFYNFPSSLRPRILIFKTLTILNLFENSINKHKKVFNTPKSFSTLQNPPFGKQNKKNLTTFTKSFHIPLSQISLKPKSQLKNLSSNSKS